jgi:hypothetical protein
MKKWMIANKKKVLYFIMTLLFSVSFYGNYFNSAPKDFFDDFQKDSEALVVGKIVADSFSISTGNTNLNFLGTVNFKMPEKIFEAYHFIENKTLLNTNILISDLNDIFYEHGIARDFPGFVFSSDNTVDYNSYLGRIVFIEGEKNSRVITDIDHQKHLIFVKVSGGKLSTFSSIASRKVTFVGQKTKASSLQIWPYVSQYGLQGKIFSLSKLSLKSLWALNSFAFANILSLLVLLFAEIFSIQFSIYFFLSLFLSPWITAFGKNLYWIPFSWFLPTIFTSLYFLAKEKLQKNIFLLCYFFSVLFKCLSGYEYISSILLFSASPFIYHFWLNILNRKKWSDYFKQVILIGFIGIMGFSTALTIHASKRGTNIKNGLNNIYNENIKVRTYGDPKKYSEPVIIKSLSASPLTVIRRYFTNFRTPFLGTIPGFLFQIFFIIVLFVVLREHLKYKNATPLSLFLTFLSPPISWFVLAKGHSYIHTHINFVLWYLGFAAILLMVICELVRKKFL